MDNLNPAGLHILYFCPLMKKTVLTLFVALSFFLSNAQPAGSQSSTDILHELKKLQNPARVLYLAAHPDDENTRMISWLVNGVGANTAYLSLTRGDGGQNLIGTELGAKLGVLRTQELMQARRIDGGTQFFTRAVDFGYSKTAEETLEKWGREEVLSDVVFVIRKFRPDVIITRFPPDSRGGHGHHTASAMLALEAFEKAADKNAFPEQLSLVKTWQPRSVYWNASTWWNPKLDSIVHNNPDYLVAEVGGYNPLLGKSYNELASLSRTQHKSQGFGVSVARGSQMEYLQHLKGEKLSGNLSNVLTQNWSGFGFKKGDELLDEIIQNFSVQKPENSLGKLIQLKNESTQISDETERHYFQAKMDAVIWNILGMNAELLAGENYYAKGAEIPLTLEIINRSSVPVSLQKLKVANQDFALNEKLSSNEILEKKFSFSGNDDISNPYWLRESYENLFEVKDKAKIGQPEDLATVRGVLSMEINGENFEYEIPLRHKFSDRVEGEINEPVYMMPKVVVNPLKSNLIFTKNESQKLPLKIRFFDDEIATLNFNTDGWKIKPPSIELKKPENANFTEVILEINPTENSDNQSLQIQYDSKPAQSLTEIDYDHIDPRIVLQPAEVKLVKMDLQKRGEKIAYILGAGDEVAEAIELMGYEVDMLDESSLAAADLSQYQAVVAGIRAYNTQEWLPAYREKLLEYVKNGGNYIVQYNTASRDLLTTDIGPYPFEISRERVTEEDAEVEFLMKKHPLLNSPNRLTDNDFEGWVQERGLYFAGEWDEKYQTPIGWHDEGEPTRNGGLLIADYGEGAFVYTGISFFRELPAGVAGAYRLLANILSYQNPTPNGTK